jgi:hypothetical protein
MTLEAIQMMSQPLRHPAARISFDRATEGVSDRHPTRPTRGFVIGLSGEGFAEASDGEVRRLGPGTVMLAEDIVGKGHVRRVPPGGEFVWPSSPSPTMRLRIAVAVRNIRPLGVAAQPVMTVHMSDMLGRWNSGSVS